MITVRKCCGFGLHRHLQVRLWEDRSVDRLALEYFETVFPSGIFAALAPRLSTAPAPVLHQRGAAVVRAELLEAAATMRVSRKQLLQELSGPDLDGEG